MAFNSLFVLISFVFGLAIGSFLNALIYRLQTKESIIVGRSHCPNCGHILQWHDLIPLFSFMFLAGKCRYCRKEISWQYPAVEAATGILFAFASYRFPMLSAGNLLSFVYLDIIISFLIVIFVYDLKNFIILDRIIFPAISLALIYSLASYFIFNLSFFDSVLIPLISAISAAAFFLSFVLVSKGEWMGMGDVKLAFFMGLFLGWPNIFVALFISFLLGAIIGSGLIIAGKKTMKSEVPFGPFLTIGTLLAFFFGSNLINWYFNFFSF